jgi:hypothetical protein
MARLTPIDPLLTPRLLLRRPAQHLPAPLEQPGVSFFGFARGALLQGLKWLGLQSGDNALLPSFICASVLDPFAELSIEVRFYDLDENLRPRFDSAASKTDARTRAFLAVNYCGFPQDFTAIRSFCDDYGLVFLEDNAHGFLSCNGSRALGTYGDISINSMRKTLGIPTGAALVVNNREKLAAAPPLIRDAPLAARNPLKFLGRSVLANIEAAAGVTLVEPVKGLHMRLVRKKIGGAAAGKTAVADYLEAWSAFSEAVLRRARPEEIARVRRQAFTAWLDWFNRRPSSGVRPLFTRLPPGVVPYAFPVVGSDGLEHELEQLRVRSFRWPDLPGNAPEWGAASDILLLPVHMVPDF